MDNNKNMDKSVIQWKWSNGIPYKKSARIEKEKEEYFESQVKEASIYGLYTKSTRLRSIYKNI